MVSHGHTGHVAPDFEQLNIRKAMVLLTTAYAAHDTDDNSIR